jgi:hypothetical protein
MYSFEFFLHFSMEFSPFFLHFGKILYDFALRYTNLRYFLLFNSSKRTVYFLSKLSSFLTFIKVIWGNLVNIIIEPIRIQTIAMASPLKLWLLGMVILWIIIYRNLDFQALIQIAHILVV